MFMSHLCRSKATDWSRRPATQGEFGINAEVLVGLGEHHRRPDLYWFNLVRRLTLNAVRRQCLLQPHALRNQHHLNDEVRR